MQIAMQRREIQFRAGGFASVCGASVCIVRSLFGIRCPSGGMTTAWSHLVRGEVLRAVQTNSGGTLLAVMSMLIAPWAIVSGCRGQWLWRPQSRLHAVLPMVLLLVGTLIDWLFRLMFEAPVG